ncbi:NAD-dependent epimerase/dehydratase family protein [Frateuria edaphi]|uniref:NAD-dependent epimerase/dehydratase family protein n=1 Tax=Frateuria edaphi TaxID=2898793 RepID=UPI001E4FAD6C|nr:NAD-dependent epimerase/dehydratase family protein [Frateuria edaphi]UGB46555.1 NAD-dependent epimerase/dehydratase family protein [Frateuria edaphi]
MNDAVLLLGAGGFVGSRLLPALVALGYPVLAASRTALAAPASVERCVGDFHEPRDFAPWLSRCHTVVHAAAASTPGSSAAHPLRELEENLRPTLALLEALQDFPAVHMVYLSSGGTLYDESVARFADEVAPTAPRSYHGAGKLAAEAFIAAWCRQYRAGATIMRPSNLYGPGQAGRPGFGIVPASFEKLRQGQSLHVWGDGSARRDYLYIDDFVRLCVAVVERGAPSGPRTINACSGESISLNELLATMGRVIGIEIARTYDRSRSVDAPAVSMCADLAHQLFGWSASTTLEEGLARTWAWFNTTPG